MEGGCSREGPSASLTVREVRAETVMTPPDALPVRLRRETGRQRRMPARTPGARVPWVLPVGWGGGRAAPGTGLATSHEH